MATMAAESRDPPVRVLLIDDDREDYLLTRELLNDLPGDRYQLDWKSDFDSGLEAVARGDHDVYLVDYHLGARTGLDLLTEARKRGCAAPIILLTGKGEWEVDVAAMRAGAADYMEKGGLDALTLDRCIRYTLLHKRYEADLEQKVKERTAELAEANEALRREVVERRRAEATLREVDRRKNEFLATLAHELRNPLAPICNALEIMHLAEDDTATVERARAMIDRQVRQLVRLVDDLLDVSRITLNKLQLATEEVTLNTVIDSALELSRPLLDKAGLTLSVSLPATPLRLDGDPVRLAQVFANLLNNAARYTERGGRVELLAEPGDREVRVTVRDTGVGISPEHLPRIFEMFAQFDRSRNPTLGGLGIGLALVRRLVEMHGGRVEVHSDGPGRGTAFTVCLPLGRSSTKAMVSAETTAQQ